MINHIYNQNIQEVSFFLKVKIQSRYVLVLYFLF